MKTGKRYRKTFLVILLVFSLMGCDATNKDTAGTPPEEESQDIQIGMSFDNFVVERWQRDRDVFVSTAKELGAEVNVQNANGDVEEQIAQMEYFIEKKVDVIVVVPIRADSLKDCIKDAQNAGIKVISYDRLALNSNVDLYISFDNEMVGTLMGEAMAKKLIKGDSVVMICGSLDDKNVSFVEAGYLAEISEKEITVVDVAYMDNWNAEQAANYVSENIDMISQVQGIMCGNDDLAREVVRVLAEQRLAGQICVVGQDADLEACQRIVAGTQHMTVYKPIEKLAKRAAEAAVALAVGEPVETTETINDGEAEIPYLKLTPLAVTEENMDAIIIDSGFHLREDVYIDRPKSQ